MVIPLGYLRLMLDSTKALFKMLFDWLIMIPRSGTVIFAPKIDVDKTLSKIESTMVMIDIG